MSTQSKTNKAIPDFLQWLNHYGFHGIVGTKKDFYKRWHVESYIYDKLCRFNVKPLKPSGFWIEVQNDGWLYSGEHTHIAFQTLVAKPCFLVVGRNDLQALMKEITKHIKPYIRGKCHLVKIKIWDLMPIEKNMAQKSDFS